MTHWITKYALTEGIQKLEGATAVEDSDGYLSKSGRMYGPWDTRHHSYSKGDWHSTEEAAVVRAEEMRAAKIKSLKKSLARMEALSFLKGK